MLSLLSLLLVTTAFASPLNTADDLIVQLPKGKIRGHILQSETNKPFYAFQEIPYGAPPVGSNRFQVAKEPAPWSDVLDATRSTKECYQQGPATNLNKSEDCLYLNVYSPLKPGSTERLPVFVWIHGGGFSGGTAAISNVGPKYMMDYGIVIVSINYRLGPFGFLSTEDDVIPGNLGLKDMILGLEWVQENIELFGGNKSSVTFGGQSAGSAAVGLMLMGPWPNNKVLFHAAIQQSGSEFFNSRTSNARQIAFEAGKKLDKTFNSTDSKELLKVLQKASPQDILSAARTWIMIEKEGPFSCQVYECLEKGNFKKVPLIIGFNSEEKLTSATQQGRQQIAAGMDKDPSILIDKKFNISSTNRTAAGNLLKRIYTNTSFQEDVGAYVRWSSDSSFTTPITKQAVHQAKLSDVYLYQFSYKGKLGGQMQVPEVKGAERVLHSEDTLYMWDRSRNSDLTQYPPEDILTLHRHVKLWTNFIKYHNPTPTKEALLENIIWPKINPRQPENIQYLNLNKTLEVLLNPRYFQKVNKVYDNYVTYKDII